ncbi:MAG: ribosome-binding factor A [Clostridiales bacterium]|nr:ribosome-binding factor A [Clostridiales bacterium]
MSGHRIERTKEDIERELTAVFRELKDPRVRKAFLTIVRIELTNDLSYCTVYISAWAGPESVLKELDCIEEGVTVREYNNMQKKGAKQKAAEEAVEGLKSASGFIRRELGQRLHLRHVPELIFKATDSIEYGAKISRILNSLDISEDDSEESSGREE